MEHPTSIWSHGQTMKERVMQQHVHALPSARAFPGRLDGPTHDDTSAESFLACAAVWHPPQFPQGELLVEAVVDRFKHMTTADTLWLVDIDGPKEGPLLESDCHVGEGCGGCGCVKIRFREPLSGVAVLVAYLVDGKDDVKAQ